MDWFQLPVFGQLTVACRAQCLKVLDSMHGRRVESSSHGDTLDVVCLKFLPTTTLDTLPSISFKRKYAIVEIDFVVFRCHWVDTWNIDNWILVVGYGCAGLIPACQIGVLDGSVLPAKFSGIGCVSAPDG